jgi:hypothetical protein
MLIVGIIKCTNVDFLFVLKEVVPVIIAVF